MNTTDDSETLVAEAARKIESRGEVPSIRKVIAEMGYGSPNHVGPRLKKYRKARSGVQDPAVELDPALLDFLRAQLARTASEASAALEAQLKTAEDNASLLVNSCQELEERLRATQAQLEHVQGIVKQQAGQLEERMRELDNLRTDSAAAIAELRSSVDIERQNAEDLRQQLVKAALRLEAVPTLESSLQDHQQLVLQANDRTAEARQDAAVASAQAEAQKARADESMAREAALRLEVAALQGEVVKAWESERALRIEHQQLARQAAISEGRCALLEAQTTQGAKTGESLIPDALLSSS